MTKMRISLFGPFRVADGRRRPVEIRARKNRALLAVLAVRPGEPITRQRLAGLLWGGRSEEQARASLRQGLSTLRRELGAHATALAVDPGHVRLAADRLAVDLATLRERLDRPAPGQLPATTRLVRGPFLEGLEIDEPAFREWRQAQRLHAHAVAVTALRRCACERLAEDPDAAIEHLRRCLELAPHHEAVHRELMRSYDTAGRTAEALQHYDGLCRTLATELAARPSRETERLAEDLRASRRPVPPPGRPGAVRPHATSARALPPPAEQSATRHAVILEGRFAPTTNEPAGAGLEASHAAAHERLAATRALVEHQDGVLLRCNQSGLTAAFGVERARGSEPERAIRAATDLRDWQAEHGDGPRPAQGLRCAIACGRVTARRAPGALRIAGPALERAERIACAASPGEVVIDETVRCLVQDHARLVLEPADAPASDPAWRLRSMQAGGSTARAAPLVGRGRELTEIDHALDVTLAHRCAHLVLVRGEAGIGKTRLLQEVHVHAQQRGFDRHAATAVDLGVAEGEGALAALVRSLLGGGSLRRRQEIDALIERGIIEPAQEPSLLELLDIPLPPAMRARYATADSDTRDRGQLELLVHLITRRCRHQPLLLSIEDIHWAGERTLRILPALVRAIVDRPVALVMTTRTDTDPIDRSWLAGRRPVPMLTLDLAPLRHADAGELARHFPAGAATGVAHCVERADGNPRFLIQMLQRTGPTADEHVPPGALSLVQTRLDALEPDVRRALQVAAVLEPRFSLDEIEDLLGTPPSIASMRASCLLEADAEANVFTHPLWRDAIRELLPIHPPWKLDQTSARAPR